MKKILVGVILVVAIFAYSYFSKGGSQTALPSKSSSTQSNGSNTNSSANNSSDSSSPTASTGWKDGVYTGDSADAFYGNVQVQATINNGKITDIKFLTYPNDQGHSAEISNQAMPLLTQEAIQAQTANVNVVTGATQTSQAFVQSLQSALDKAKS